MNRTVRSVRECWEYNQPLERLEGVRRCSFCAAREDRHNLPADMCYYGYAAHEFQYPSAEEVALWKFEGHTRPLAAKDFMLSPDARVAEEDVERARAALAENKEWFE